MMKVRVLVTSVLLAGMCGAGQSLFAANAAPDEKKSDEKKKAAGIMLLLDRKEANASKEAKAAEVDLSKAEEKVEQCLRVMEQVTKAELNNHKAPEALVQAGNALLSELEGFGLRVLKQVIIKKFKQGADMKSPLSGYNFSDLNKLPRGGKDWNRAVDTFNAFVAKKRDEKIHVQQLLALIGVFWGPYALTVPSGLMEGDLVSRYIRVPFCEAAGRIDAALATKQEEVYWEQVVDLVGGTLQYDPNSCPLM